MKRNLVGKIFGIALVFAMIGAMFGGLPGIANAPPAEGAGTPQPGKASTVSAAVDGALGEVISITYGFPQPRIEETWEVPPVKGALPVTEGYVSVAMESLPQWSEPGLPALPFKTARILLPYGADVQDITVTYGNKVTLPGSYVVEPGQEPVPLSHEGPVNLTLPNSEVYDSSSAFPGELWSDATVQSKTGYRILLVNLHPVEYIPKAGQLCYYESMTVKVTLGAAGEGEWLSVQDLPQNEKVLTNMVDNPEIINSYAAAPVSTQQGSLLDLGDYEYVIITNEALEATPGPNNFQALRDSKVSRGITATIVTTEWIYANYSGARPDGFEDNQTRIRNFIIDVYNTWGTRYVLLGGDGDGADVGGESGDDIIPHRGFASTSGEIDYDIPADMYYACLDGTFDDNANGIYGEPNDGLGGGEVDLFAEVYVGRAPVDSQTEVNNFVSKTLAYQNISKTDENLRKVWMAGEYLGFGGVAEWGGNSKDEIKEGSSAHGYTTVGFEDSAHAPGFDVSTLYDRDYSGNDWPKSEIVDIINDNAHLINHLGHSWVNYAVKMYNPDVDALTNDELYFIGYSQGCYCGSFDDREYPGSYTNDDCISEHLTTEPHGAVAFIANSRYGWGTGYSTDGPSQHYDREFWDAIFGEYMLNIGIANQDSKEDNAGRVGSWVERWCYYELNLFGDPELSLKLYEGVVYDSHQIDDSAGGDGDGYPEPGESIEMPVTLRNTATNTTFSDVSATLNATTLVGTTIFSEDFEGSWPGDWIVGDEEPESGEDYWGLSDYRAYRGSFSAYCAEASDVSGQYYDNDMEAFIVKDVDLSAYDSATLSYKYWLDCESYYDHLDVGYFDGSWHWVQSYSGGSSDWVSDSIEAPPTAIQVAFLFYSDVSVTYEGAYVDDVVLTGHSWVADPYISISDASEEYGDISASGTATSLDAYDFTIDPACPVGHMVRFNLDITASNGGPWTDSFDARVEGPDLVVADKWEEWVDQEGGNYTVHYIVKNLGNVAAPASHETALTVDGSQIEAKLVPVELAPGEEYEDSFNTTITLSQGIDEITVCADIGNIIEELSEENNCRTNRLTWDVVQVTTDPGSDYDPAMTQTDDGKVWVVWQSYRPGSNRLWYKTSSDGGANWSEASPIDTGIRGYEPAITQTNDGKIWVTFYSYESGNDDIWYTTSSNGGGNWSVASQITTDAGSDYKPAITQTADGKVWVVWQSYRSGNPDIWYKTSSDGGATWANASQVTTDPGSDYDPAITQTADGKVWVVWRSYRSGGNGIWCKTSPDGGLAWSEASPIDTGIWGYGPAITQTNDGKIWVTFRSYESGNRDIWYTTSFDGGANWSEASQFTRFVGYDYCPAVAALSSGKLAVAWQSDRAANYDIWCGVIGYMEDINPPPHLDWAENEPVGPEAGETVTVRARASDELGLQDVQLVWWEDGSPQGNRTMYDDGNHDDYSAGDGVYGIELGSFPLIGTVVEYQIQITDIDNNTVLAPQYPYSFEVIKPFVKTADILLVNDYPYSNSIIPYYSDALDNLGYAYDVWDSELRGNIDGDTLNQYEDGVVIWATPDWGYIGYSETQHNLSSYLDNGGKLFISGQDIGSSIGWSDFYQDYLHAQYVQDDIDLYSLFGVLGDPITDGLYINISGDYGANNQYSPSEIDPILPAVSIFTYDPAATTALVEPSIPEEEMIRPENEEMLPQREPMAGPGETMIPRGSSVERSIGTKSIESSGTGALRVDTGTYKVVYFAFGFEAINSAADRATVMERVLNWLAPIVTYNLTISSTPGGSVTTPGEGTFTYNASEVVNLVASAEPDYHFTNWTGDIDTITDVNSRKTTITMNGDYSITANFAEGVAEVDSEWGKVGTPHRENWTIAPNSDILVPASLPGGEVIYVVGSGYEDNDMSGSYGPRLWKSEDSGVTWDDLADKVWDADGLPAIFDPSNTDVTFNYVACAEDDSDFLAVALVDDNGTSTYCDDYQAVVISDDGGDNFAWTGNIIDDSVELNRVFDMKVSNEDNGKRNIALGGVGTKNATCPTGLVFRYRTGGLTGGRWVEASAYDGWDDDGAIASQAVTKVRFAPSWLADRTVLAVSHTATKTYLQSGTWGNTTGWNEPAGFVAAVEVADDPSMWSVFKSVAAGVAVPTDYEGRNASTHYAWVYVDRTDGTGVIYRVKNGAVVEVSMQISGNPWLASISYLGSIEEGKALAGLLGDGAGAPTDCCKGVQVYFNDGIADMDICCERWSDACKPPTGTMAAIVGYVAPNKAYAFVGGTGAPYEEGAFSFSLDDGDTWNQLGLVDTYVNYLSDVAKSADCTKTWVVSVNTEGALPGFCGCDSVWLKASWLPEAPEYSGAWIREWCKELTSNEELNSAQTPEIGLLRVPEQALSVYVVDRGSDTVYYDSNKGLGCWETGSSTVDQISDLAVQDEATIYAVGFDADVAVSDDHGYAASWSNTMDSKVDGGHTIAVHGEGNVLVGGADGKVSYSDSDLATFLDGEASFTELDDIGDGRVHVAFDSYFDTNDVIYAAVSVVGVDNMSYETPVNDPDNGIYRWVIGESSKWKDLGECAGTATPTETQLGLGPSCDKVEVGYYGIVLSNAEGNPETDATTGGVLYATFYDAAGNITGAARCLNPAEEVACGEALWDYLIEDVNEYHGAFTLEPSSLKICGCLTPDTNSRLWAIDDNWYYDYFATDAEDSDVGRLWTYEDCYAKSGTVLVAPADGAVVPCDQHYWWNDAFALKWERQCDACSYNLQIAYDEDFTGLVLDISGKDADCQEIDYEPTSGSNPSYVVAEGALGPGSCGTTFYWRVRSADAETGEIIHSPWSEVRSFTVAEAAEHYNLTISSTDGGNVTTPGEETFTYNAGDVVDLVATADSGYQFVNWTGDTGTIADVNSATTNITMIANYSIMANFAEGAPAPVWSVGDNWVYNCSYENPGGNTEQDTNELNVTVVGAEAIGGEDAYKLSATFVPEATRDAADMPLTLHIGDAEIWNSKAHMEYLKQSLAIAELPGLPMTITWNYTGDYGWPYGVGKTWSFTKHSVAGPLDEIVDREGKVLGVETVTVPAGTFECYHIVAYAPAIPGNYTYEHWFNSTVVKSDVKTIDRDTWAGVETRVLTCYSVQYNLTINSTSGGNVTTPGEGTFSYNASEVVDLVATADSGYQFVNWSGDTETIADVNSETTNITMDGSYIIMANFEEIPPVEEDWSVPLAITSDIGSANVTFGANSSATDGFDADYDIPAPMPPMEGVEAYFYYPDNPEYRKKLATSVVAPADSIIWPLKVKYITDGEAGEVTMAWESSDIDNVPAKYITLELADQNGTKLADMRTNTSYNFTATPNDVYSFQIKAELFYWDLKAGWNMISLPVDPGTTDPDEIFCDLPTYYLYTWNAAAKRYDVPNEVFPCKGYWILVFEDATQTVRGTAIDGYSLSGNAGWHMIGSLSVEGQVEVSSGDVFTQFHTWDATDKKYVLSTSLEPGRGYWLLAFTDFSANVIPKPTP